MTTEAVLRVEPKYAAQYLRSHNLLSQGDRSTRDHVCRSLVCLHNGTMAFLHPKQRDRHQRSKSV